MGTCPDPVKRLIDHFNMQLDQVRSPDYNETQLRIDFVNPLFAQLGWDMDNAQGFAEQYREVVHEDRVKVAGATKAPDYSFRIGGVRKFFLEAKKPFVNIKQAWEPAYQLRRYGWSAKLPVSLLTDFEELAIYDCRVAPRQLEKPATARRDYIVYTEFCERWDFLEGTFSKRAILQGEFDRYCATKKGRGTQEFDEAFLLEIETWRKELAYNLALRNDLNEHDLNFATQRIIDRIIFLRICEDRGVEPTGHLQQLLSGDKIYHRLLTHFREADDRYNSGLFHFKKENGRDETPDEFTPTLEVDDGAIKTILKRLYYPESPYEFTVVSADILGSVYERFLGKVIERHGAHGVKIVEKPEVRKAGGVYYTPTYIVDYIVKQTVGKLLEGKTPDEAKKIKVLDPACGSGSFLLGAYQYLLDWHLKWYVDNGPEKCTKGKTATLRPADRPTFTTENTGASLPPENRALGHWALTTRERKRILLDNIHGVDIDYQAVEVTKLSLLLRCLEGETAESLRGLMTLFRERALPDLGGNIQCGNSLIGTDIMATDLWRGMSEEERGRINPFDFERAFTRVFKQGGFDAVIGNPPWLMAGYHTKSSLDYFRDKYRTAHGKYDLYYLFLERGRSLIPDGAFLAMIVPNKFFHTAAAGGLRKLLSAEQEIIGVINFGDEQVFVGATNYSCILLLVRGSPNNRFTYSQACKGLAVVKSFTLPTSSLTETPWHFEEGKAKALFDKMASIGIRLSEITERFGTGVQTGADRVYAVTPNDPAATEKAILRRQLKGRNVRRYRIVEPVEEIVFPYEVKNSRFVLLEETRLRRTPRAYSKLLKSKQKLSKRIWFGKNAVELSGAWYGLMYLDDQRWFERPHILTPTLSNQSNFVIGEGDLFATGTAGVVSIVPKPGLNEDIRFLLGLLNSSLISFFVTRHSPPFSGGFFKFSAPYLRDIPIRRIGHSRDQRLHDRVIELVELQLGFHASQVTLNSPQEKDRLRRQIEATDRQVDQLVYQLYDLTDAEIRLVEESTAGSSTE
jgi:hypothetical protein